MNWDELAGHAVPGVLIGSHSVSHPHLVELYDDELRRELNESKAEIEDRLGRVCWTSPIPTASTTSACA